jgi:imidazolonepropionase-like amidohydrolase
MHSHVLNVSNEMNQFKRARTATIVALLGFLFIMPFATHAQQSSNRVEGLRVNEPRWHVLTNTKIVVSPTRVIERGTLVIRDGRIVAVGEAATTAVPSGARVWNLEGRIIYAGMIDMASQVGVPQAMRPQSAALPAWMRASGTPTTIPAPIAARTSTAAQNRAVRAELDVARELDWRLDEVKVARELGFTSVLAAPAVGVFRGQSALLNLADSTDAKSVVLQARVAQHLANEANQGFGPGTTYPGSIMGAIALIRQTLYDARWAAKVVNDKSGERVEANAALDALQNIVIKKQPAIYAADSEQDYRRIANIKEEFNLDIILQGNGYEYRRAAQLKALGMPIIVPLNFPSVPEIENPDHAIDVPLDALQHWEQAPSNLSALQKAAVEFAITTHGLRDVKEFWPQLRLAVKRGLRSEAALAALTTTPAKLLRATQLGTLEVGKIANITVATGDLFLADTAEIDMLFVDGKPYVTPVHDRFDARGTWQVTTDNKVSEWKIAGTRQRPTLTIDNAACDISMRGKQLVVQLPCAKNAGEKQTVIADSIGKEKLSGTLQGATTATWSANRIANFIEPVAKPKIDDTPPPLSPQYPAGAFGVPSLASQTVLIKNATLWTNAKQEKLADADMLVRDGKIISIGKNLSLPADATTIDASGKHVTAGIIDAHSHTAVVGGVNEGTSSITAEVRVGDVLDATDINIYRQLAGGVTAANVLHGSANTIGGQNQVIKFRWGSDADGLKFANAMPGIKFALGENVKQSNREGVERGLNARYPQTRMGVAQILRDGFQAAQQYRRAWANYKLSPTTVAEPRRDLQLDALVEILDKKRIVHIHSYRADEILMFVRLAQEFGFTVGTFQHVLEGYKVADAMASIGAGGSTFSDWWSYKMEVYDAIPTNAAIMHRAGVVTTLNSDSDELARRLNTEAAKTVRYGGMSETEALKFVTLNAAKQLRVDDKVGSLEVGKDADFVIWSASPLSTQARAEQTWIEGRKYYDVITDAAMRQAATLERERLVAKALPLRFARLNAARPTTAAEPLASPTLSDTLEYMAMQRWLHDAKQNRHSYWDGGAWHECTEDAK